MPRTLGTALRPKKEIEAELASLNDRFRQVLGYMQRDVLPVVNQAEPPRRDNVFALMQDMGDTQHLELAALELVESAESRIEAVEQDLRILLETAFRGPTSRELLAKFFPRNVSFLVVGPKADFDEARRKVERLSTHIVDLMKRLPHFEFVEGESASCVGEDRAATEGGMVQIKGSNNVVSINQGDGAMQNVSLGMPAEQLERVFAKMLDALDADRSLSSERREDLKGDVRLLQSEFQRPTLRFERIRAYLTDLGSLASLTALATQVSQALPKW